MDMMEQLPKDVVLQQILPRLDYTTWVRVAAVNKAWRLLSLQSPPPGQDIPCIWLCHRKSNNSYLHPPSTSTSPHRPSITKARIRRLIGSYRHYLLFSVIPWMSSQAGSKQFVFVHNTITGKSYSFPATKRCQFTAGAFSCSSRLNDNSLPESWVAAVAESDSPGTILHVCCRPSGLRRRFEMGTQLHDLIFHKGELYCINKDREVVAFDVSNKHAAPPRVVVPTRRHDYTPRSSFTYYLVESSCGDLLVVAVDGSRVMKSSKDAITFTVHRVDEEQGEMVGVDDIGDQMLFVGAGCSRSVLYGSRSWPFQFFTRNSIYFFYYDSWEDDSNCYFLGKFSLKRVEMKNHGSSNMAVFHQHRLPTPFRPIWIPDPAPRSLLVEK